MTFAVEAVTAALIYVSPKSLIGQTVDNLQLEQKFNIRLLSTLRYEYYEDSFGRTQSKPSPSSFLRW